MASSIVRSPAKSVSEYIPAFQKIQ
jgi:hypothetical protein